MSDRRGNGFDARLSGHVDTLTRLEEQKQELADMVKERMALIKADGYEAKIVKAVVKERFRPQAERERARAIMDLYLAALGYLDGTPMGDYTLRELEKAVREQQGKPDPTPEEIEKQEQKTLKEAANLAKEETIEQARERGLQAGKDGKPTMSNPYGPTDARRAAWDEGWVQGSGRTGFEIPESLKPKKRPEKKKKDDDDAPSGGGDDGQTDIEDAPADKEAA